MSYYDEASLVFIPSGYKTSKAYSIKPTSGDGDLSFTRSNDTATRVGPDGLIEKVRTNLNLYSQDFTNAHYGKANITVTANSVANPLDGVVNADTIVASAGTTQKYIGPNTVFNGLFNYSVYVKYVSQQFVQMFIGADASPYANFDIQNGTASAFGGAAASIVSVGSGWYRLSMSFSTTTGIGVYLSHVDSLATARFSSTSSTGSYYAFGAQIETGDIATPYIATTTAAVSVGPVANVPRLDYLNSSCPRLLLEPQRTNLALYSEQFDNAAWSKYQATITANGATSPDGSVNADKFLDTTANDSHALYAAYTISGDTTFSIFVKSAEYTRFAAANLSDGGEVIFNLSTATVVSTSANYKNAKIENYGNGWYRVSATTNGVSGSKAMGWSLVNNAGATTFTGTGTSGVFVYGGSAEVGAYATSYIPTLGAAVTRGADACSKTGISSLIGQTEGTLFAEFNFDGRYDSSGIIPIVIRTSNNEAYIFITTSGSLLCEVVVGAVPQGSISGSIGAVGIKKVAFAYKQNDFVVYLNGVQVGIDSSGTVGAMADLNVGSYHSSGFSTMNGVNQALLFKTRLSNSSLAELTSL